MAKVEYKTNPPTSGDHYGNSNETASGALADGAYPEFPPVGRWVHSMEHGRVVIHYSPDLPEEDQLAIKGVFEESPAGVIMFPNPEMDGDVAVTSWTQLATCENYEGAATLDLIRAFRDIYRGQGPEGYFPLTCSRTLVVSRQGRCGNCRDFRVCHPCPKEDVTAGSRRQDVLTYRLRQAILITAAAALLGPASANGSVRGATDFDQPLDGVERSAAAGEHTTYRSRVLQAPERFDLAGLEGEMREAELRGRVQGGAWTDWAETANGDPVWFGGMDELQVRTHGWKPAGRVHYVSVPERTSSISERAGGGAGPNVISRRQWGANKKRGGCKPRTDAAYGRVKAASVHHTVSAVDYSESEAKGMILGICRFHRNSNGWNDIGYNTLVDRFGNIYEGRGGGLGRAVIGAHAQGVNAQTTGVAVLGTHTENPVSRQAMKGLVEMAGLEAAGARPGRLRQGAPGLGRRRQRSISRR